MVIQGHDLDKNCHTMNFSEESIKTHFDNLPGKITELRRILGRPLSLSEKILYSHLYDKVNDVRDYRRGDEFACFTPDRVAMQDATAQMALLQFMTAGRETSCIPASVHCDHLIIARAGASSDLADALAANSEVYDFLRSVSAKYKFDFWDPGSGIIHQVILENYAFPGGMITGTDSHTPTAGGLGMMGIGVGGSDAVDAMTGMPWELKWPRITGIRLTGRMNGWTSAKDLILKLTGMLTVKGAKDTILEYFGEGTRTMSATGKATICNMGAETGATSSIFGFDYSMKEYLNATGRKETAKLAFTVRDHLNADPEVWEKPEKYYDDVIEINLSGLEPYINGPFSPDVATPISGMKETIRRNKWPDIVSVGLIGSCTNSSYEDLSRAASVIKNAIEKNIPVKAGLKISPGSDLIRKVAEREQILDTFKVAGGEIFASACGPCIGQWERNGTENNPVNSIVHSFNRNFSGRADGNPNTHAFVASPEIAAALTVAGQLSFNPLADTLTNSNGEEVKLDEPEGDDLPLRGLKIGSSKKPSVIKTGTVDISISPDSQRLQYLLPFPEWDGNDFIDLRLLIRASGKCTTDHISMAGKWLKYRGHLENISGNYMMGATNSFNGRQDSVFNPVTGAYDKVNSVAGYLKVMGIGTVVVGEENFGEGSSREHAAMEPRFLGVKAVIVKSFARIHETNLKKQGVLTLTFDNKDDYDKIREDDRLDITGLKDFYPGSKLKVVLHHSDRTREDFYANHSYNEAQIEWFRAGSALNMISRRFIMPDEGSL